MRDNNKTSNPLWATMTSAVSAHRMNRTTAIIRRQEVLEQQADIERPVSLAADLDHGDLRTKSAQARRRFGMTAQNRLLTSGRPSCDADSGDQRSRYRVGISGIEQQPEGRAAAIFSAGVMRL